jgi:signal transduction histidine kinase
VAVTALVGNALRYLAHGTRQRPRGSITVMACYDAKQSQVVLDVRDDGPGIVEEIAGRLFMHDDPRGPGGLALLLVHDILTAHGGGATVRSSTRPGESGTIISLTIPCRA